MTVNTEQASAISIGNFDGFHLGHGKIVDTMKTIAQQNNLQCSIITFSPHPRVLFKKLSHLITTESQKREILGSLGVRFEFMDFLKIVSLTPEQFVTDVLLKKFRMKYIIVGKNFKFGKDRGGGIDTLETLSHDFGFRLVVVPPVKIDGTRVSSSRIRESLLEGEIAAANRMLGRSYYIDGEVVHGEKIGKELGFPTINLKTGNTILPEGVFKTKVSIGGDLYDSVTNIGTRPTFYNKSEKKVEAHILDFDRGLYGKTVRLYFEKKLRNEKKFDSESGLVEQIKKDIECIKVDKDTLF